MDRRRFLREMTAIGGAAALAACLHAEDNVDIPTGNPDNRPDRQHAWNESMATDDDGNPRRPRHHVFLSLSYEGSEPEHDRDVLSDALLDLERAYAASNDGLLFTIGYSPAYFERFDDPLASVDLPPAAPVLPEENVAIDDADAFLHLGSDHASAVLGAEEALFGDEAANETEVTSIDGIFAESDRRTGFWGAGLPAKRNDNLQGLPEDVLHDDAPSFVDFRSGFRESLASEDRVTIEEGRFAGGTTMHVSTLWLVLSDWFDLADDEQIARLFGPALDPADVGDIGEELGTSNRVDETDLSSLRSVARQEGVVGHAQKMSRFREDGTPPILRRDVNSDDYGEAGLVFVSLQRTFEDFRRLRLVMEGHDVAGEGAVDDRTNNGILRFIETRRRGNFLVPPRDRRALPLE